MKEQIKAPEKIQLSDEEIANLSDAQFKTLVISMLIELVKYDLKIEERVKSGREWSGHHCSLSAPPPHTASQCSNQPYPALGNT